ncbi:YceI family protein [Mycolicibacterium pulveris]|uniref:YceI family protein n=1 Tax=Mycolicibacterium pulveris TaxID=36813 RepID=UPI003CFB23F9
MTELQQFLDDPTSAGQWRVVPDKSSVSIRVKSMWGLVPVTGRFSDVRGEAQLTGGPTIFGRIAIRTASLRTGIRKRDTHLHSADFFDAQTFPDVTAEINGLTATGADTVELRGQLTIKNTTKPLSLTASVTVLDDRSVRFRTQTRINRQEFGVDGNLMGMIVDIATISGDIVFRHEG